MMKENTLCVCLLQASSLCRNKQKKIYLIGGKGARERVRGLEADGAEHVGFTYGNSEGERERLVEGGEIIVL